MLVLVVIFKCHLRQNSTAGAGERRTPTSGEGREKKPVGEEDDPAYDSVDTGEGRIVLEENRAYGHFH